jgi:hypothetical protein
MANAFSERGDHFPVECVLFTNSPARTNLRFWRALTWIRSKPALAQALMVIDSKQPMALSTSNAVRHSDRLGDVQVFRRRTQRR